MLSALPLIGTPPFSHVASAALAMTSLLTPHAQSGCRCSTPLLLSLRGAGMSQHSYGHLALPTNSNGRAHRETSCL